MSVIRANPALQPQTQTQDPVVLGADSTTTVTPTVSPPTTPVKQQIDLDFDLKSIFPHADLSFSIKSHYDTQTLILKLTAYIQKIPNYQKLKLDSELTLLAMNIIKNEVTDKTIDQTDLLVQIFTPLFDMTPSDITILQQQVIFLKNHNHVIGIPLTKKFVKSTIKWASNKFG